MNRIIPIACILITMMIVGYLMVIGRGLIIPLILAIFVWHLLNTTSIGIQKTPWIGPRLPSWLTMAISLIILMILVRVLIDIISNNVNQVIEASPRYQENFLELFNAMNQRFKFRMMSNIDRMISNIDVQNVLMNMYGVFTTVMASAVLIALYVVFLFVEQHFFKQKIDAMVLKTKHKRLVNNILVHIIKDTQTYLGVKTLLSLLTATLSWLIMKWVGLDFAEFWALLIFFLNYIPNIGSILATIFPSLLALIQFASWLPFLQITIALTTIQFVVGNLIEPRFLGKSLNLSPLVILIALALWGTLWGFIGMFLAVPLTVIMMIIFAHFDATRPIAVLLSQDGYVKPSYEYVEPDNSTSNLV